MTYMSTRDPAPDPIAEAPSEHFSGAESAVVMNSNVTDSAVIVDQPVVVEREVEVSVARSVRFGRVLIGSTILGAAVASLAAIFFPISAQADYSLRQIMGFMLLIGASIGLALGAILSLILAAAAKRRSGTAVAIQSDVR
jgi:hypothetical protein